MPYYFTRHDSMTQATTTFAPVETAADGSTAGPIRIPTDAKKITRITASVAVDGAQVTNTGPIFVLRLSGTNALVNGQQDLIIYALHLDDGGGTLTYTDAQIVPLFTLETEIEVVSGSDLQLQASYYGTDAGSPQLSIGLEFT